MAEFTIPGGSEKGKPLIEAGEGTLRYWHDRISKALADGSSRYVEKDTALVAALKAELASRASGDGQQSLPATGGAVATTERREVAPVPTGAFRDPLAATEALRKAAAVAHLVAPAPLCGSLPEGCEVAMAAVLVDAERETYPIQGKRGLGKVALDRIAAAAGVSWDPRQSGRIDDRTDPYFVHYRAVGQVRDFDGSTRMISGEVSLDVREGGADYEEIVEKAKKSTPPRDPKPQILELRKFILRHAESKAKNRAIRSLGVRTAYDSSELAKPFVVAKIMFTGHSEDPEARRQYRGAIADSFLGGRQALYPSAPALPAPAEEPAAIDAEHATHEAGGEAVEWSY